MATALKLPEPVTIEAFDAWVETKGDDARLYELVDGVIVMMSNPTEDHEQIASNIGAPLKLAMDKRNCRTCQGGMRVQMSEKTRRCVLGSNRPKRTTGSRRTRPRTA